MAQDIQAIVEQAINLLECGEYAETVKLLTPAHQSEPKNDEIIVLLAEALTGAKRSKKALALLEGRAKNLDASPEVVFALGDEYFSVGNMSAALEHYQSQIPVAGCCAEAWLRIGLLYVAQGKFDDAEQSFVTSLRHEPENSAVLNSLGDLAMERHQRSVAKQWYEKAAAVDGDDPEAWANLAELFYDESDLDQAYSFATKSIECDDNYAPAWLTLGYIALDQDDESRVRQCFNKFLALEDGDGAEDIMVEVKAVLSALNS